MATELHALKCQIACLIKHSLIFSAICCDGFDHAVTAGAVPNLALSANCSLSAVQEEQNMLKKEVEARRKRFRRSRTCFDCSSWLLHHTKTALLPDLLTE
jgi:hypothetical protein